MKPKLKFSPVLILSGVVVILAAGVFALLLFIKNQPATRRGVQPLTTLPAMEPDIAKWGVDFPNQYSTYLITGSNNTQTTYGGSALVDKLKADPRLVKLFAGYSFSKQYNEDRGHMNSLIDVRATLRINDQTPGTCYSCKSSDNPQLWADMGMATFDKTPFKDLGLQIQNPIGCANCHEANTMRLIVTNPALEAALAAQGKDWRTFTRQEMRSVVCANCHVEYYFAGEGKLLTFPWKDGTTIDQIEQYYSEIKFTDWTHPESGAQLLKMQHPDYELYTAGSTHYQAGVSCADCHMPYLRQGAAKFSSHNVMSPLENPAQSCGACHTDVDFAVERVKAIQQQVAGTQASAEEALVAAIDAIKKASNQPDADPAMLASARDLHRSAQMRWDFIAAENSMGFHNPEEALRILASATDLARQAQVKAQLAVQGE